MNEGFVSLVGAGPGDPELITIKGLRRLGSADVVVYDALVHPDTLALAHPDAELIAAGKRGGRPSAYQEWINDILIDRAQQGLRVVRLKGGDPFVFGRGGEEAEALVAAGIAWEVVPGVTSAIAAPAYAGIPVTHRDYASSVAFITGHEKPGKAESNINWQALAQGLDTLVFLMPVKRLSEIAAALIAHGRSPQTPAALVHAAATSQQTVVAATLETLADTVERVGIGAPATLIVGEVAALHHELNWYNAQPGSVIQWNIARVPLRIESLL